MTPAPYATLISTLRHERGLSQAEVAKKLDMSRSSYVALEKGTKELSLREAVLVTKLFSISLEALTEASAPTDTLYRDMIHTFLRAAKQAGHIIKKTKLAQLLYLADMSWYYQHHESLSHLPYRKSAFGAVPDAYFRILEELEGEGSIIVTQVRRDDYHMYELSETRAASKRALTTLSPKATKHLSAIYAAWSDATTAELLAFTTAHTPYREAVDGEILAYERILADAPHLVV